MILPRYRIAPSGIPGAGQGVFLEEPLAAGRIAIAPDAIDRTWTFAEILSDPDCAAQLHASARWFEDRYTLSPDWPDECYVNHGFEPTGLWLLGFIFATRDLVAGEELTVDYRHLLAPGQEESFRDALTGGPIVGFEWKDSLRIGIDALRGLLGNL
ncbi:MAG TPA: SET domain-containing protein [Rhodanobacteraceae bacterium]|nr:SET domain-containing protein [Rhodanobacteraceae bacterium]